MFPNPSSNGHFSVVAEKYIEQVEVMNQNGVIVFSGNFNSKNATLNANLSTGLYLVKVTLRGPGNAKLISLLKLVIQ